MNLPDIDIEVQNRDELLSKLKHIPASRLSEDKIEKHLTGVYFNSVPLDPISGFCSLNYKEAEQEGYVKVDLLHNHVYQNVKSKKHLRELIAKKPTWELLAYPEIVEQLFQIHSHFETVNKMKPSSLEELAITIAIIRPGKKHLIRQSWDEIRKEIWVKDNNDKYFFKKSHAFAFAQVILVQLALLEKEMLKELNE